MLVFSRWRREEISGPAACEETSRRSRLSSSLAHAGVCRETERCRDRGLLFNISAEDSSYKANVCEKYSGRALKTHTKLRALELFRAVLATFASFASSSRHDAAKLPESNKSELKGYTRSRYCAWRVSGGIFSKTLAKQLPVIKLATSAGLA